jgi:lipopolysaccharide/colanic/teichoic acid biosynthesis glycosyltransferase
MLAKRMLDLTASSVGLVLLLPLFLLIGLLIYLEDRGAIFFLQKRVGFRGKEFAMWKFRSMVVNADKLGQPLTVGRDPRITRIGIWLRKLKLDELPQLINVVLGEMSLVGPRPEVMRYVNLYNDEQKRVLNLLPGITDLASIRYRNENDLLASVNKPEEVYIKEIMPEKIKINLDYAKTATFWSDIEVIFLTLRRIFTKSTP